MGFNEREWCRRIDDAISGERYQNALQATLIVGMMAYNPHRPIDLAAAEVLLHGIACYVTITRTQPTIQYLLEVVHGSIQQRNKLSTIFPRAG